MFIIQTNLKTGNVLEEFPKLKRNIYEDYVKEWFQSKE
jgi:hypothetical protein